MTSILPLDVEPAPTAADVPPSGRRVAPAWTVARKEWLELTRDARWHALLAVTLLLMAAALALGILRTHRLEREHRAAELGDRSVWTAQGAKNPHSAAHFGQYAFKPVGPLGLAEPGVDAFVGSAVYLEAHKQNEARFRTARDATLSARMGHLTLAFVLQTILPLLAILLGFAAFSGEREKGTLPQLLSLGVSPARLLLGKGLTAAGVLLGLLAIACLGVGLGLSWLGAGHLEEPAVLPRLAGLMVGHTLYLLGFLALALAVSARASSSRAALVGLLVFWLINCFIAPRLASDLVDQAVPLPSAEAFQQAVAQEKRSQFGHDETHPAFVAFRDRVLRRHGVARVEDLPVSFRGLSLREDDETGYRIFDRHFGALQARIERQDLLRSLAGPLFPMLALRPLSMAMAGTDNRHQHDFLRSSEGHRRRIQTAASQDLLDHARNGDNAYVADAALWERIPSFHYERPGGAWAYRGQWHNLASLVFWCLGTAAAAWGAALRPRLA